MTIKQKIYKNLNYKAFKNLGTRFSACSISTVIATFCEILKFQFLAVTQI